MNKIVNFVKFNKQKNPFLHILKILLILLIIFSILYYVYDVWIAQAADTGFLDPSANTAVVGQGDGNGYQTNPTHAYSSGTPGSAEDINSGANTNDTCDAAGADKHDWYNYGINVPVGSSIVGIEVRQDLAVDSLTDAPFSCISLSWDGGTSWTTPQSISLTATGQTTYTYGGADSLWGRTWTISDLNNTNFRVRITNGDTKNNRSRRDFSLDWIPVKVYYSRSYTQSAYRLFTNTDTTDVGVALAAQDRPATLTSSGQAFRLRTLLHVEGLNLGTNGEDFKLQYVDKGTGTCDVPVGGVPATYTDVSTTTLIAYKNNSPSDGTALSGNINDPVHGGDTIIDQTYEEANNFTNSQGGIDAGQDGMWDFALQDYDAFSSSTYCFRIVKSDGTELNTYDVYPEITTATKTYSDQLIGSDDSATTVGLYEIAPKTGTTKFLGTPSVSFQSWGSARRASDGLVFLVQYGVNPNHLFSYNINTGTTVDIGSLGIAGTNLVRLAFDGNGVLYGMNSGTILYSINTSTGAATELCNPVTGLSPGGDIAFSSNGTFYAMTGNQLYMVNIGACTSALVGDPGITNLSAMAFDGVDVLYASRYGSGTQELYTISTINAAATLIAALSPGVNFYDLATSPVTNTVPNIPVIITPVSGSYINDNTPTLSANYSDPDSGDVGTTNYRIATSSANCLSGVVVISGTSTITLTNNENTTWTPSTPIGSDGTYYWCAQNDDGILQSTWVDMGNFILDTIAPTVSSVDVQSLTTINISFSEAMGIGSTTAANYIISESGQGTLATNPTSVSRVSSTTALLSWVSGSMVNAADITVTVVNAQDLAGNVIGIPFSARYHIRGIIHTGNKVKETIGGEKNNYNFH